MMSLMTCDTTVPVGRVGRHDPTVVTVVIIYSDTFLVMFFWLVILLASMRQSIMLAISVMSSSDHLIFFSILEDLVIEATKTSCLKNNFIREDF